MLADSFALYLKTKNFHWHVSGPHFRDYHLMLDEQGEQIFATTDEIAERVRKIGGTTLRSIGHIVARCSVSRTTTRDFVDSADMLRELRDDNKAWSPPCARRTRSCDEHDDVASASLLENFIDAAEKRVWFLFEASRAADATRPLRPVRRPGALRFARCPRRGRRSRRRTGPAAGRAPS